MEFLILAVSDRRIGKHVVQVRFCLRAESG